MQPWRWAERNVIVPLSAAGTRWDSTDAIFVREIMESFADESINEIVCMVSAQSAKTLTFLCLLAWAIAEDPGPMLWVAANKEEAKKLAKGRLLPLLEKCGPVLSKMPTTRDRKTTLEIYFPGAPLIITGAESTAAHQSTPYRYLFLDEARSYRKGALEMIAKRVRSYTHNYKKVIFSTPDMEKDALHRAFLIGDRRKFFTFCCNDECRHPQVLEWKDKKDKGGVKWDTDDATRPGGKWDWDKLAATVRYECERCGHQHRDEPEIRKRLSGNGAWRPTNDLAPSNMRTYHWNALLPWWTKWADQVKEWLMAREALRFGDHLPMKDHINETRGEVWSDQFRFADEEKIIEAREIEYNPLEAWEAEARRFLVGDVQARGGRHFWLVGRAWAAGGRSRLLVERKVYTREEILDTANQYGISEDNIILDCGFAPQEVFQMVVDSGYRWKAFKGDDKPFFERGGRRFMWSQTEFDPALGTAMQGRVRPIKQFLWSKPMALERLTLMMHGQTGEWHVYRETSRDYRLQVTAWQRRERVGPRGDAISEWVAVREPHMSDCEQMQVVAAAIHGLLGTPQPDEAKVERPKAG